MLPEAQLETATTMLCNGRVLHGGGNFQLQLQGACKQQYLSLDIDTDM